MLNDLDLVALECATRVFHVEKVKFHCYRNGELLPNGIKKTAFLDDDDGPQERVEMMIKIEYHVAANECKQNAHNVKHFNRGPFVGFFVPLRFRLLARRVNIVELVDDILVHIAVYIVHRGGVQCCVERHIIAYIFILKIRKHTSVDTYSGVHIHTCAYN